MDGKPRLLTIGALIGLADAIIYLDSFWSSFGVDIFQFAGLSDFAKLAIFPMSLVAIALAITVAVDHTRQTLKKPDHRPGWLERRSDRFWAVTAIASIILALLSTRLPRPWEWYAALIASYPVMVSLGRQPIVRRYLPNQVRGSALIAIIVIPILLGILGEVEAQNIIRGKAFQVVDTTGIAANLMATRERPLMLVGFVNDTFILFETQTRSVVFLKQAENSPLILKPNPHSAPVDFF
ncbi:hypothetical protein [Burkholderia ubonensis]|nr:hypothetical protein [Burkholderia ubonensis]